MADPGTPWAMVGSPPRPPNIFLGGKSLPGGRSGSADARGPLEARTLGGALEATGVDFVSSWNRAGSGVDSVSSWNGASSGEDSVSSWNGAGSEWTL